MVSGISDDVREIIEELDADGGGFRTGEAAGMLVHRYVTAGICDADGEPKSKVRSLMRMGANTAVKGYRAFGEKNAKWRERAAGAYAGAGGQHDFDEVADDFDKRWLLTYSAFEECDEAERKMLIRMTLPEVLAVIALKRKKAAEAAAVANRLQDIIDRNVWWHDMPLQTLADVLGIRE